MNELELMFGACIVGGIIGHLCGNSEVGFIFGLGLSLVFLGILGILNKGTKTHRQRR